MNMKKDLGDHIGKKKGWAWYEIGEILLLAIKQFFSKRK